MLLGRRHPFKHFRRMADAPLILLRGWCCYAYTWSQSRGFCFPPFHVSEPLPTKKAATELEPHLFVPVYHLSIHCLQEIESVVGLTKVFLAAAELV